ncbi:N-acetyl-gamma-glutamyl-phosphate reductase [Brevibacillus massiliensis]|jgi:N-acetyl-gamma-glutamyl-phosphate reductase|uniref:N-acetyl-gamma-glutamyl-phosphate reductase n=1 Tax=Brevibacillus massiliensis TaxID=1118054 RepID=UPI0002F35DFE|nr:N-acetyl-gamma-glutamyl-phosphate reductase [Brevibacillus massiliensis]
MIRAGIVGATGYSGIELVRLLSGHPNVHIQRLYTSSAASEGEALAKVFGHIEQLQLPELQAIDTKSMTDDTDVIFLAAPAGVSAKLTPGLLAGNCRVIDLSGDFRLKSADLYRQWYKKDPAPEEQLAQAVYGLHEWNREAIADAVLLANPGCYPTAVLLALVPLIKSGWVNPGSLIVDAKSGISGAGRGASLAVHFSEVNENFSAYKVGQHQHTPEIEQELSRFGQEKVIVQFTPHLVPMTRGIFVTAYAQLEAGKSLEELQQLYESAYADKPFVRVRPAGSYLRTKDVYGSNYCDIALHLDERTGRVIVLSVIDNMVKGAAGQAVQNMNTMFGMAETTGLLLSPVFP